MAGEKPGDSGVVADRRIVKPDGCLTMNNRQMRTELLPLYNLEYPGDRDTGCPAEFSTAGDHRYGTGRCSAQWSLAQINLEAVASF